jgi:hypothetical protein
MTIFGKKQDGPQLPSKLTKRVANISTPELVMWVENSLFVIGKNITHWERERSPELLEEAHMGAEALYAITTELKNRNER